MYSFFLAVENPSKKSRASRRKTEEDADIEFPVAPDGRLIITEKKSEQIKKVDGNPGKKCTYGDRTGYSDSM